MRDAGGLLGLAVLHVLLLAPGAALLLALGLVRPRPLALAAAAGPALLAGWVVVGVPIILALVLGLEVGTALSAAIAVAVTAACAAAARRRRPARAAAAAAATEPVRGEVVLGTVALVAVAATFVAGTVAFAHLPTFWDDANIWSLKGVSLYYHEGLVDEVFRNPGLTFVHLDYPLMLPVLEASFFRAVGGVDLRLWHAELWVAVAAGLWTLAWLLAGRADRRLWVVVVAVVALSPLVMQNVTVGDADAAMAIMLGCGALSLGLWLERGEHGHAVLGGLLLGGAANVKNEGLAFAVAVAIALLGVVLVGRVRRRRDAALPLVIAAACIAPWLAWLSQNDAAVRGTPSPVTVLGSWGTYDDSLWIFRFGLEQVAAQVTSLPNWGLLVPVFVVVAVVLAAAGVGRPLAAYYLASWLLAALAIGYTYWVTPIADITGFQERTGPRIVLGVVLIAAAGLGHLLQVAGERAGARPGGIG